jgi:Lar family restriction alleviation protein
MTPMQPCPFCGSNEIKDFFFPSGDVGRRHRLRCETCETIGPVSIIHAHAAVRWNDRHTGTPLFDAANELFQACESAKRYVDGDTSCDRTLVLLALEKAIEKAKGAPRGYETAAT